MKHHTAKSTMLIHRPVAEVFRAFVDPDMITSFWLEATTAPLAKGAQVTWHFMVPGATETVTVTEFDDQRHIGLDWSGGIKVSMTFEAYGKGSTKLVVEATGFKGENAEMTTVDATEGFTIVLCDLKTFLETGRSASLVRDKAQLIAASRPSDALYLPADRS
jgi:uncharacterized protein YndB with AHSA1/START domain